MTTPAEGLTKRLRELLAKATPGEWTFAMQEECEPDSPDVWAIHASDTSYEATLAQLWSGEHDNKANGELIVAMHEALPALLSRLEELEARGEPVGEVSYSNWNGVNIDALPAAKGLTVGTKLYLAAHPAPAVSECQYKVSWNGTHASIYRIDEGKQVAECVKWAEVESLLNALPAPEPKLDAQAQVGNTIFSVGIAERHVIGRAKREYLYQQEPEQVAERQGLIDAFRAAVAPPATTREYQRGDFESWLRATCFQKPTPEAYDLAKCAWRDGQAAMRERVAAVIDILLEGYSFRSSWNLIKFTQAETAKQCAAAIRALGDEGKPV